MRSQFIPQNVQEKNWACSSKPVLYLALNRAWKQRIPARGNNCSFPIISLAFPFTNLDPIHIILSMALSTQGTPGHTFETYQNHQKNHQKDIDNHR
jgi:hypothetical protein